MPCTTGYNFHKHLWEIFGRKLQLLVQLFDKSDFLLIRKFLQKNGIKERGALFFREINFRKIFVKLISRKKMRGVHPNTHTNGFDMLVCASTTLFLKSSYYYQSALEIKSLQRRTIL